MSDKWITTEWASGELAEPKKTLGSILKPYVDALVVIPLKIIAWTIAAIICCFAFIVLVLVAGTLWVAFLGILGLPA